MTTTEAYGPSDVVRALRAVGVAAGDTVFVQACHGALGSAAGCASPDEEGALLADAVREVVGEAGTIVVPTYTFSLCKGEVYDVRHSPAVAGPWNDHLGFVEHVRRVPGAVRSLDPIFSVAAVGPRAATLLANPSNSCLGEGSVFQRLARAGARLVMIGVGLHESTFQHHAEEMARVPWRFRKLFTGRLRDDAGERKCAAVYNVRIWAPNGDPAGERLAADAHAHGVARVARLGGGEVWGADARAYLSLAMQRLCCDPWYTAKGPAGNPVELERARVGVSVPVPALPPRASMEEIVRTLCDLPRHIVSEGYDAALEALSTQLPMAVHEYPSGAECWSWIVPEKWTCHEAYLETLDGERLVDVADHPLHVVSYSLPFEGEVSRETLLEHLHVHPVLPDAVPWQFKYYERDWGLCCTRTLKESLRDDRYRVVIRTSFSYGTLKVGEVVAPGRTDETIVLCAHLCHPAQANDDLSGVAVGMDVMRALLARRDLRYTYRLLILPETIGSVAYLSHNERLIPKMRGGLFLEMLGLPNAHSLMLSHDGQTEVDECFTLALKEHDRAGWTTGFRTSVGNDERMFNAPGVRVPMLSLTRVLPLGAEHWPYPEYHSSADTPALVSVERLADSRDLVLRMIDTLEGNTRPVNRFKGEVFCSRYGLHVDWYTNPEGNRALFDIVDRIDGTSSVVDIARACGVSFRAARMTVDELRRHGLVDDEAGAAALAPSAGRGR
jgi:aminopeptidase-like protein/aminoglycoside N3'-acetyltransferase